MQRCGHDTVGFDLGGHRQVCGSNTPENSIEVVCRRVQKPLKLRHYDISRTHFQGTAQRLIYIELPTEDRQKYSEDKVGRMKQEHVWNSRRFQIWQLDHVNLICGELGGFRRGKHSAALFHNPNQNLRMAVHGDDFVCLSDDDGRKHMDSLSNSKYTAKDMGTLGFEDSDVKSFLLLNRLF